MTLAKNHLRPDAENATIATELVSVIIPCYNHEQFLGQAIESVLRQSYPHFEVIVVDDDSTDNTSEVAARYSQARLIRQKHAGAAVARNRGFEHSKGSYLVFLDSDDRLLPDALSVGIRHLRDHPECAFVFGRHREIAADGRSLVAPASFVNIERDPYRQLLLYNCVYTPSTAMFRRAHFDSQSGFDHRFASAEDYELYLRIARKFPILAYDKVVAEYRRHAGNSTCDNAHMLKVCLAVMREQRRSVLGNREWEEAYKTGVNNWRTLWGERLVSEVWSRFKERRQWKRSVRDLMTLARYGPEVFPRQLGRKLRRSIIGDRVKNTRRPQVSGEY